MQGSPSIPRGQGSRPCPRFINGTSEKELYMPTIETIAIKVDGKKRLINKSEYDPAKHTRWINRRSKDELKAARAQRELLRKEILDEVMSNLDGHVKDQYRNEISVELTTQVQAELEASEKDFLVETAKQHFGVSLDRRKNTANLRNDFIKLLPILSKE
jgi:putative protein kinase ArgK-like GTPase of G3E family